MAVRHSSFFPDRKRLIGLVLSGGGARGAFQVGVWHTLRSDPRGLIALPTVLSGTSAGALNSALIAAGLTPEAMLHFWLDLAESPPVIANESFFESLSSAIEKLMINEPIRPLWRRSRELRLIGALFEKHKWYRHSGRLAMMLEFLMTARFDNLSDILDSIATPYLFSMQPVRKRLREAIGGDYIRNTDMRLAINVVDVRTGGAIRLVNHRPAKLPAASLHYRYEPEITIDMILASASIPLIFNPVRLGADEYWDGGVLVNTPMAPAVALGATRIIPVNVTVRDNPQGPVLGTFGNAIERLVDAILENAYIVDRKLLLARNEIAARGDDPELRVVELYRAIRPLSKEHFNAGSYLYFERNALISMYEAGKRAARSWLDAGPELDSRDRVE